MLNLISAIHGTGIAASTNSYESIATVTVAAGGSSSISFTSIPSTYKHLQIRGNVQTNRGTYGIDSIQMTFNSDTGSNYTVHWLFGDGASASASSLTNPTNYLRIGDGQVGTSTGGTFGGAVIDVLDYQNTNKYKTVRGLVGVDVNGTVGGVGGRVGLGSGVWMNSGSAVSTINVFPQAGSLWTQYSSFALYGIKG